MPSGESGALWRKTRGGREYGSYHTYAGGRIVNLATAAIDEAHRKARELLGTSAVAPARVVSPSSAAGAPASATGPSFLQQWATTGGAGPPPPAPANSNAPGPPPPPTLTSAMEGLAEGMATAVARFNALAISLAVKHFGEVQPPKPDPAHLEQMEKTWATGLKELMLIGGVKWWHILLAQNGALALELYQNGTPIPPKVVAPVAPAAA